MDKSRYIYFLIYPCYGSRLLKEKVSFNIYISSFTYLSRSQTKLFCALHYCFPHHCFLLIYCKKERINSQTQFWNAGCIMPPECIKDVLALLTLACKVVWKRLNITEVTKVEVGSTQSSSETTYKVLHRSDNSDNVPRSDCYAIISFSCYNVHIKRMSE